LRCLEGRCEDLEREGVERSDKRCFHLVSVRAMWGKPAEIF
jgi:hypothetical protein